jgi:hypothetical protein
MIVMKKIFFLFLIVIFISCTSKRNTTTSKEIQFLKQLKAIDDTLTTEESNIVNDFLNIEFATETLKYYYSLEIILIEEAGNGIENLVAYEYAYKDFHSDGNKATAEVNERLGWILDTIQIKDLKNKYIDKKQYHWKSSDIKNIKVNIMKKETFRNIIRSNEYIKLPEKIVIYITKPLMIDNNSALISFRSGSSRLGFTTISNYTALMKKTKGKWQLRASYWDGSIE